jgi:hypothetical protein
MNRSIMIKSHQNRCFIFSGLPHHVADSFFPGTL